MSDATDKDILQTIRRFVERDVIPGASEFEHKDEYPQAMVNTMKQMNGGRQEAVLAASTH